MSKANLSLSDNSGPMKQRNPERSAHSSPSIHPANAGSAIQGEVRGITEVFRTQANFITRGLNLGLLSLMGVGGGERDKEREGKKNLIESHLHMWKQGLWFSHSKHNGMVVKHLQEH